jgi:DNA polymerase-1
MEQFGFSSKKAKHIEKSHHELYKASSEWLNKELSEAKRKGFVEGIFGFRLRTPLQSNPMARKHEKTAEARSAGNMITQSYGLLTIRAMTNFMHRVWGSKYRTEIRPISTIYDSIYLDIPDTLDAVLWVNKNLIECMEDISGCPELEHNTVRLGADLEVFPETWAKGITIPNNATRADLYKLANDYWSKK